MIMNYSNEVSTVLVTHPHIEWVKDWKNDSNFSNHGSVNSVTVITNKTSNDDNNNHDNKEDEEVPPGTKVPFNITATSYQM